MIVETEGIVLKEIKTSGGRRCLEIFTERFGKITAFTGISERGKNKSTLALSPFTCGKYEFFKSRGVYNLNKADTVKSYYAIGENVEKYMYCSYVLELTERLLTDEQPAPALYRLILDFFQVMLDRKGRFDTLAVAYGIRAMVIVGIMPELSRCVMCGSEENLNHVSVREGGIICDRCCSKIVNNVGDSLIYTTDFGIVEVMKFISKASFKDLARLAVKEDATGVLKQLIKDYYAFHLDIKDLKSEAFL